MYIIGWRN
jgi:hypothetical protein